MPVMPRKTTKKPAKRAGRARPAAARKTPSGRARKAAPRRRKAPAPRRSEVQRALDREPLETPQLADRAAAEYDGLES
jgi:hypothetical protein